MFRKFLDGMAFGAGFGIACVALYLFVSFVVLPAVVDTNVRNPDAPEVVVPERGHVPPGDSWTETDFRAFFDASIDERIDASTAIALAKYERSDDGRMKAVISEYLKLEAGVKIQYGVGDEHPSSSYYPTAGEIRGDGLVIFFAGSPARMVMSTSVSGDRITGLSDIPLELFREKCTNNGG